MTRARRAATVAGCLLVVCAGSLAASEATRARANATPIEHIVVLMQENHSFDNYFGTYPGTDGIPDGACMPIDPALPGAECVEPFHLGDNDVNLEDPVHSASIFEAQLNGGLMDGFVKALAQRGQDGRLAMGYYDERDLPYYWNLADEYVLFDHFFSSTGPSFANHFFWVTGAAADERPALGELTPRLTIFDRLQAAGLDWKFYIEDYDPDVTYRTLLESPNTYSEQVASVPLLNIDRFIDDPALNSRLVDLEQYYVDLERGTLPAVAYMVSAGTSEHPTGGVITGQRFVRSLVQALMRSDAWESSAFMVTYDDWGGWYDHVPPPAVDEHGYGFRVPAFLVGGYARHGHIESTTLDYTSILRFIEDNWNLEPLAERDRNAASIAGAFDFTRPPRQPDFVSFERSSPESTVEPRREILYAAYGAALVIGLGAIAYAALGLVGSGNRPESGPAGEGYL